MKVEQGRGDHPTASTGTARTPAYAGSATPACGVCHTPAARYLFSKDSYGIHACGVCGAEFLFPQPTDEALAAIYTAGYFVGDDSQRVSRMKSATAARYLDFIVRYAGKQQRTLLEIGCGTGDFLMSAMQRGFEVHGIEFSEASAAAANEKLKSTVVVKGTLEMASILPEAYDIVVGCDVLEHVRVPETFLRAVYRALKPGGMVFLVTPSKDSWSRLVMQRHWMEYKTEHLYYFGRRSLSYLLGKAGFKDALVKANKKVLSLDYIHHHFQRFPVPGCSAALALAAKVLPAGLMNGHFTIPASGLMVAAWKPRRAVGQEGA